MFVQSVFTKKLALKKIMESNSAILMIKARIPENHSR
ncbi:hypothetical protein wTkk_000389 [Wolbachia endosymbiont of Trichogramma kaykai]